MLTAESALAIFIMLALSSVSLFLAQKIRTPHTVFLVGVGVLLGVFSFFGPFHFIDDITLTPALLFYLFLPILIFESAYNINIRRLTEDAPLITILSVISLLVSAFVTGLLIDVIFSFLNFDIPFVLALLFGAIISATDPVAVLALFKEYGAPRRLSLLFEGESIFNDGTGVALFLVVLAIAESGVYNTGNIVEGSVSFLIMVIGGIVFGLIFGGGFAKLVGLTKSNEFASITMMLVLAHATFICAELFSTYAHVGYFHVHVSPIIATAVASLLMGNYGRYKILPNASEFVEKYWSQFAFLANSLIFILIGMLAVKLPASAPLLLIPLVLTILAVAFARALSIYPIVGIFNLFSREKDRVPTSWQHVLAWGSLRGALAVTMVLLIPDTLSFPGWDYPFTPKELILTLTIGCIFATLFIKATSIGFMMKKLRLNTLTPLEEINLREMGVYLYHTALKRLKSYSEKGYINADMCEDLTRLQRGRVDALLGELASRVEDPTILKKVIKLHAIGIERKYARELYTYGEITEPIIRHIMSKLEYQARAIELDIFDENIHRHGNPRDVFQTLADFVHKFGKKRTLAEKLTEQYLYYRALAIISRKVKKELCTLEECFDGAFTLPQEVIDSTVKLYDGYHKGSTAKLEKLREEHKAILGGVDIALANKAIFKNESIMLESLKEREMVTPKVAIALEHRFHEESTEKHS